MAESTIWDEKFAQQLVGATVLVGLRTIASDSSEEMSQFYGTVISTDRDIGVTLELCGSRIGETWTMPPDLRHLHAASSGEYHLASTNEVVVDPDYTTEWILDKPLN